MSRAPFRYRADVLARAEPPWRRPTERTRPELAHEFISEVYRWELRALRDRLLREEVAETRVLDRVVEVRTGIASSPCGGGVGCNELLDHCRQRASRERGPPGRDRGAEDRRATYMTADALPPVSDVAPQVYHELRRLAAAYMRRERPGQTLQATALVHEAYLRLANAGAPWTDKRHFIGIAARSMRQILFERARARGAQKRWAGLNRVSLSDSLAVAADPESMLPALDEALTRLRNAPEQPASSNCGSSRDSASRKRRRRWTCRRPRSSAGGALARAWLHRELSEPRA